MARTTPKQVRIRIRTSFNDLVRGQEAALELTPKVQGWLDAGLAEEVKAAADVIVAEAKALRPLVEPEWVRATRRRSDGTGKARPGGAEQGDNERVTAGADRSGSASREPGPGFGTGGYGTSEG